MRSRRLLPLVLVGLLAGPVAACSSAASPDAASSPSPSAAPAARSVAASTGHRVAPPPKVEHVLAVSVDALNPDALRRLGSERAPNLNRLVRGGAHTLNARTSRELTDTLPNHTGMVTGRRVDPDHHGHGVTWNDDRLEPRTVQDAAGHAVGSLFTAVHQGGGTSALFSTKTKLSLFARSWPDALGRSTIKEGKDRALVRAARHDLVARSRDLTFVHLGAADVAGHAHGFMGPAYLDAVSRIDGLVGRLLRTIRTHDSLDGTVVVLTADHGGRGADHHDPTRLANYRIPFTVWGPGIPAGDLYRRNPDYRDPGERRTSYHAERQPVRNGDLANLALDLLGLPAVSGSRLDHQQDLDVY